MQIINDKLCKNDKLASAEGCDKVMLPSCKSFTVLIALKSDPDYSF